jgi:predicted cupin superfamily sugar epimerase
MKAGEIASLLGLVPLPHEGGYYAETYRSAASTAIYYMLTPDDVSALHRLDADEIYHFYLGDPVEMLVLEPGGGSALVTLGRDIAAGQRVQHVVPRGTWQCSRLAAGG